MPREIASLAHGSSWSACAAADPAGQGTGWIAVRPEMDKGHSKPDSIGQLSPRPSRTRADTKPIGSRSPDPWIGPQSRSGGTVGPVQLLGPYRWSAAALFVLVAISAAAEVVGLFVLSAVLAAVVPGAISGGGGAIGELRRWALEDPGRSLAVLAIVYVGKSLLALWATYASFSLGLRMADDWSSRLLHGYLTAPLQRLTRQQGSMVNSVLGEPSHAGSGLATGGVFAQSALSAASVYAALLVLSPLLTLGLTLMAFVALGGVFALSRYAQSIAVRRLPTADEAHAAITETIGALKQLRLFNLEKHAQQRVATSLLHLRRVERSSNVVASSPRLLIEIIFLLGLAALIGLSTGGTARSAALADVGLVIAAAFRLLPSLSASAGAWVHVQQAWPGLQRIAAELTHLEASDGADGRVAHRPAIFRDRIVVDGVHFTYPGRRNALEGINLDIERGQFIGIVGPSGSGKSTLVDLLCAFYAPDRGQILIDGVDLREIDRGPWRQKLGVVAQDSFLFNGTVRDNLTLLRPTADPAVLDHVVSVTGADAFIAALPDGYDTRLGERGLRLSGGQRQRLALARVLLKAPEVLILDEATSALDIESDERLRQGLEKMREMMTLIVVAHRLTSVRSADRIYVLAEGRIAEQGTHEELIRHDHAYAAMWRAFGTAGMSTHATLDPEGNDGQ